jgi:hypothetical protein
MRIFCFVGSCCSIFNHLSSVLWIIAYLFGLCIICHSAIYGRGRREIGFRKSLACLMVLNSTFNNISAISWWSVLLV